MQALSFFTPIFFVRRIERTPFDKWCEIAEDYFYLGGKRICITGRILAAGLQIDGTITWQRTLYKVALYATSLMALGFLVSNPSLALPKIALIALKIAAIALVAIPFGMIGLKVANRHYLPKIEPLTAEKKLPMELDALKLKGLVESSLDEHLEGLKEPLSKSFPFKFAVAHAWVQALPLQEVKVSIQNRIKSIEVIFEESLEQIHDIPSTQMFTFTKQGIEIAVLWEKQQKYLDRVPPDFQKEKYLTEKHETLIQQLAIFIARTGFNRVSFETIPLVTRFGTTCIVLSDFTSMTSAAEGLFGGKDCRGLIHCVGSDEEVAIITSVAKQYGICPPEGKTLESVLNQRKEELKKFNKV